METQRTRPLRHAFTRILNELPDFHVDMGDTFMVDAAGSQSAVNTNYLRIRGSARMGGAAVSVPMFLTPGNHEQEEGWNLDEVNGIGSIQARKWFFPTPTPDDGPFYSANSDPLAAIDDSTYGDDYREDYYEWTWGDALFVVIDTFEYTLQNPYGNVAGEGSNDPAERRPVELDPGQDPIRLAHGRLKQQQRQI